MKTQRSISTWINLAGSAALIVMIATVTSVEARQQGQRQGGVIQKGKNGAVSPAPPAVTQNPLYQGGGLSGQNPLYESSAASAALTACDAGQATACRTIESGLASGGAWRWKEGNVTAMDDWEPPVTGRASSAPPTTAPVSSSGVVRGNHIPSAVITGRVLAACDAGDVTACRAFASSVRPSS